MNRDRHKRPLTSYLVHIGYAMICVAMLVGVMVMLRPDDPSDKIGSDPGASTQIQEGHDTHSNDRPQSGAPSDGYEPTSWDPVVSPDIYKVHGEAIISENDLAPGDVRYHYNADTRTQSVHALLTYDNIEYGKRERESISHIDPVGWPEDNGRANVTFPDGKAYNGWFWNRSHLLGHALGGEDEEKNLMTGTRAQNVGTNDMHGGMQYAETLVRDYLESNRDGQVYYIVRPVYLEGENIPRSVFVDMRSDDGSIDMHLEVYNVMPGYDIDYKTGRFAKR